VTAPAQPNTHPGIGIIVFTVVESVILTLWLVALGVPLPGNQLIAGLTIAGGLLVEHTLAYNVGAGRPLFSLPPL